MSENEAQTRAAGGRWKPGVSGNPGGRSLEQRLLQNEIERIHAGPLALGALERLRRIGMGEIKFGRFAAEDRVQVLALTAYLDRVGITPRKPKEDEGANLGDLSAEEMLEMAAELARRAAEQKAKVS